MGNVNWDWTAVIEGLGLFGGIAATIISLWVKSTVDEKVEGAIADLRRDVIDPMQVQLSAQHDALVKLTARCDQQATRTDVHDIALQIQEALGEMKAMRAGQDAMHDEQKRQGGSISRINDYLLNGRVT